MKLTIRHTEHKIDGVNTMYEFSFDGPLIKVHSIITTPESWKAICEQFIRAGFTISDME